ncbi:MAG: Fn3-like domain-containing protein, partial [Hyphomonas sp.]
MNGTDVDAGTLMIEVAPFSEVELNVTITPPATAPDKAQYGGYLSLQSKTASSLVVPYSGFKGDYQSIEV